MRVYCELCLAYLPREQMRVYRGALEEKFYCPVCTGDRPPRHLRLVGDDVPSWGLADGWD